MNRGHVQSGLLEITLFIGELHDIAQSSRARVDEAQRSELSEADRRFDGKERDGDKQNFSNAYHRDPPQIFCAVSATNSSFRRCSSYEIRLPGTLDAKPHWGLSARFAKGT